MAGFTVIAVEWLVLIGGFAAVTVFAAGSQQPDDPKTGGWVGTSYGR